jgi:DNA polymerase-3 subunit delta
MLKLSVPKLTGDIEAGNLLPVYYFIGDDVYRKLEFADKIKTALSPDDFNFTREDASAADIGALLGLANTAPVFSNKRLIILNNADKIKKGSKASAVLEEYLKNPLESTCLVVLHNDAKKAKKDRTFEDACGDLCAVVNFEPLEGARLSVWMQEKFKTRGLTAEPGALMMLEELAGADLTALNTEIEKLSLYTLDTEDKTVKESDVIASIGFNKEENPFALSNAVLNCDRALSLKLTGVMLGSGEDAVSVLNKISACAVKMLRIKRLSGAGLNQYEIVSAAGLLPWEGRLAARAGAFPSVKTMLKTLDKIIETDTALKSSSGSDPGVMIKSVLLTMFAR